MTHGTAYLGIHGTAYLGTAGFSVNVVQSQLSSVLCLLFGLEILRPSSSAIAAAAATDC